MIYQLFLYYLNWLDLIVCILFSSFNYLQRFYWVSFLKYVHLAVRQNGNVAENKDPTPLLALENKSMYDESGKETA